MNIIYFLFRDGLSIWTAVMAIAIIITASIAIVTLRNSGKRQRYEFANQLYKQFQTYHLEVWQAYNALSSKKYESLEAIK